MQKILVVEDKREYWQRADECLRSRNIEHTIAVDYDSAIARLLSGQPGSACARYDGAIIDCFFPKSMDGDITLGREAVEKMRRSNPGRERTTTRANALAKVGSLMRRETAKLMAKKARVDYAAEVDPYWNLEQAMKEDAANQPLGILVAEKAEELGMPFVLATSTYHHDELTQPIQDYAGSKGWMLVDCAKGREDDKATVEFWERAFDELRSRM